MSRPSRSADESDTDHSPKDRYEGVLRTIDYNTGGPYAVGIRKPSLFANRAQAGYSPEQTYATVKIAIGNDDLICWRDREGRLRLARTAPDSLRDIIEDEAGRDDPSHALIGRCNKLLAEAAEGRGED